MEFFLVKIMKMGGIEIIRMFELLNILLAFPVFFMLKYILLVFNKKAYLCDFFFTPT